MDGLDSKIRQSDWTKQDEVEGNEKGRLIKISAVRTAYVWWSALYAQQLHLSRRAERNPPIRKLASVIQPVSRGNDWKGSGTFWVGLKALDTTGNYSK